MYQKIETSRKQWAELLRSSTIGDVSAFQMPVPGPRGALREGVPSLSSLGLEAIPETKETDIPGRLQTLEPIKILPYLGETHHALCYSVPQVLGTSVQGNASVESLPMANETLSATIRQQNASTCTFKPRDALAVLQTTPKVNFRLPWKGAVQIQEISFRYMLLPNFATTQGAYRANEVPMFKDQNTSTATGNFRG
ncbi:hypothetical protein K438DRAFT_1767029 [Mycena galopus ATCC 62051]|nr:hypothetical protein K438DRAFT_1767029 [Mycena galopus ATCC 62051]